MCEETITKMAGLWFTLSLGSLLAATVNPSVSAAAAATSSSSSENTKLAPAPSTSFGAVYREPRDYSPHDAASGSGYSYRPYERPQSSRCISCLYAAMGGGGGQDRDRYYDPFYYNYRPGYPSQGFGMPGYAGPGYGPQRETDDRNWYYPNMNDDRHRYSQYENRPYQPQQNRYDYRPGAGGYDRNDYRQNYQDYRGNGYDNRDPMYFNSMRGGNRGGAGGGGGGGYGNRDNSYESYYDDRMSNRGYSSAGYGPNNYYNRPNYNTGGGSGGGGYDQPDRYYGQSRPYERPERPEYYRPDSHRGGSGGGGGSSHGGSSHGGYDDYNFRPLDQTYRGVSGFDSFGHGFYFANNPYSNNNPAQPSLPQNNPHQQSPPRPFQQHQSGHHDTTSGHSPQHQQHSYNSDSLSHGGSSGGSGSNTGKGSYDNNWHYINSNDRNSAHHGGQQGYGHSQDKDTQQSPSYGERPGQRPLSTSYLHERDTPTVISRDSTANANQMKTTASYDSNSSSNNTDTTDKPATTSDALKMPSEETNTVSSSTGINDQ